MAPNPLNPCAGAAFVAMLLVLGTQRDEGKGVTGRRF